MADRGNTWQSGSTLHKLDNLLNEMVASLGGALVEGGIKATDWTLDNFLIKPASAVGEAYLSGDNTRSEVGGMLNQHQSVRAWDEKTKQLEELFGKIRSSKDNAPVTKLISFINEKVFGGERLDDAKEIADALLSVGSKRTMTPDNEIRRDSDYGGWFTKDVVKVLAEKNPELPKRYWGDAPTLPKEEYQDPWGLRLGSQPVKTETRASSGQTPGAWLRK